jgi:hypothetical protein
MKAITTILTVLAFATITSYGAEPATKADPAKPDAKPGAAAPNAPPEKGADKPKMDPEKAFARKDANGDGKLSKEEFMAKQKDAEKAEKSFKNKDKDESGDLSKEEFAAPGKKKKDA